MRVRYDHSLFQRVTRRKLRPQICARPGRYRSDLNGMAASIVHPPSNRPTLRSHTGFQSPLYWRSFVIWNALGGISWAITVGVTGYLVGTAAEQIVEKAGIGAAILAGVLAVGAYVYFVRRRRRHRAVDHQSSVVGAEPEASPAPEPSRSSTDV